MSYSIKAENDYSSAQLVAKINGMWSSINSLKNLQETMKTDAANGIPIHEKISKFAEHMRELQVRLERVDKHGS